MNDYNIHRTGQCYYQNYNSCNFCKYGHEYSIFLENYKNPQRFELDFYQWNQKYFKKYWENPQSISNIKLVKYVLLTSKHKVNKKIEQLDSNNFVLEKVVKQVILQFLQNIQIKNKIVQEQRTTKSTNISKLERIEQMLNEINGEISKMETYYFMISLYKTNIHTYKSKYTNHLGVIAGDCICFKCHLTLHDEGTKSYKNKFYICKNCSNQNRSDNIERECMVCLDLFKHKDMVYMACGNGHKTCATCFSTLINYTNNSFVSGFSLKM